MNITLNQKMIQQMCGKVSFKRGDYFYRTNKVVFDQYLSNRCQATVTGEEEFRVTIEKDAHEDIRTECSCPKLASFDKDCQHIAAVLLAIYDHQLRGTIPAVSPSNNLELTEGLRTLFTDQPHRSSGHQLHFEKRKVLDVEFTCKPVAMGMRRYIFGIEMNLGSTKVENIRVFLEQVKEGNPCQLSPSFTYDPSLQCFQAATDAVIQQLIQVIHDEKVFGDVLPDKDHHQRLLLPSSSWERLLPLLLKAPGVKLEYDGRTFTGLDLSDDSLPLQFDFTETVDKGYQLTVKGFHRMVVLDPYRSVLYEGKIIQLESQDCKRLSDLQRMLDASGTNQIPIPKEQIYFFLEKVAQGLKKNWQGSHS